jgi:hypothetical protein
VERTVEARRKAGRRKDAEKGFMMAMRFDQMCKWVDAIHSIKERNYEMRKLKNQSFAFQSNAIFVVKYVESYSNVVS